MKKQEDPPNTNQTHAEWLEQYYDIVERTEGMIAMNEAGVDEKDIRLFFKRVRAVEPQTLL